MNILFTTNTYSCSCIYFLSMLIKWNVMLFTFLSPFPLLTHPILNKVSSIKTVFVKSWSIYSLQNFSLSSFYFWVNFMFLYRYIMIYSLYFRYVLIVLVLSVNLLSFMICLISSNSIKSSSLMSDSILVSMYLVINKGFPFPIFLNFFSLNSV